MREVLSRFLRWLVAPATEPALRSQAVVSCVVRALLLAAALGVIAALLAYVQLAGRGAPLLGGTPSSAAVFLAAVAALLGRAPGRTREDATVPSSPLHRQEIT